MSAYPLPTAGCKCDTCEWLRKHGLNEGGILAGVPLAFKGQTLRCVYCGLEHPIVGAHSCPTPPG